MKNGRIVYEQENYRVMEYHDEFADMDNLKGDMYNPVHIKEMNPGLTIEQLKEEEKEFEELVNREGVYGYVLEYWNPSVNGGWEQVDSCWGFVGQHAPSEEMFNHYIVEELKNQIPNTKVKRSKRK